MRIRRQPRQTATQKVRTEHAVYVMTAHLRPHPNLPWKMLPCRCDLCEYASRLATS